MIYIYIYIDPRGACSVHPFVLQCLHRWSSQLSSTLLSILPWVRHRNFHRIGLVQMYFCTLLPPGLCGYTTTLYSP